jgi:hypothetical protein
MIENFNRSNKSVTTENFRYIIENISSIFTTGIITKQRTGLTTKFTLVEIDKPLQEQVIDDNIPKNEIISSNI